MTLNGGKERYFPALGGGDDISHLGVLSFSSAMIFRKFRVIVRQSHASWSGLSFPILWASDALGVAGCSNLLVRSLVNHLTA